MKPNSIVILLFLSCFITSSCSKENHLKNENDECIYVRDNWSSELHIDQKSSNSIIRANLILKDKILLAKTINQDKVLSCLNLETGEELWTWNDKYEGVSEDVRIQNYHEFSNIFYYLKGTRFYGINVENGNSSIRKRYELSLRSSWFAGDNEDIYSLAEPNFDIYNGRTSCIYEINVNSGELNLFLEPEFDTTKTPETKLITGISDFSFYENGNETFAVVEMSDPYPNWNYSIRLGLYNLTEEKWEYSRVPVSEPSQNNTGKMKIVEDKVYINTGNYISCHDIMTGERLWKEFLPTDFLFSGFTVADGKVIANGENSILYCLDAETGDRLWEGEGAGTSSRLDGRYLNGYVYFSGGSTGRIHAVDCSNGNTVWRLDASEYEDGANDWKPDLYVTPGKNGEKGKVIIMTHNNAYCVDAIR